MTKVVQPILKLKQISEHSQLETKKRENWIRTVIKEALKALRCTHVQGGSPNRRIYGLTYKVKVALNGYGWTLKDPQQKRSYPPAVRNPLHASEETRRFHARWSSPPHMHYLASQGVPIVKALTLSTLNSQLKCTVSGMGASENPMNLEQKRKHNGRTTIHETQLGAIQVFNDRTPIDNNVSLASKMLPKHRYSPSPDPTLNLYLGQSTSTHQVSHLQKREPE